MALQRLIGSTGSTLDAEGEALYRRLVTDPNHVAGALAMMAGWDLDMLRAALPRLAVPLHQIVGGRDRTVPPADARRVQQLLAPAAAGTSTLLAGLGHLAHEEQPRAAAELMRGLLAQADPIALPRARAAARST